MTASTSSAGRGWLVVLLAAAGTFALTMGARQSMGLFVSTLNTSTGLGIGSISLAFAFGQLWWGLTQPFAGIVADRIGAGRVLFAGVLLVALGTALVPISLLALPAAWVLRGNSAHAAATAAPNAGAAASVRGYAKPETTRAAVARAIADPSYRLLCAGFFVCGFHVAFIATHLPGV